MNPTHLRLAETVIKQAVAWYARRSWWTSATDLEQEAWVAALDTLQRATWPNEESLPGYLNRAVARHLSNYCWRMGAPVSVPRHESAKKALSGVRAEGVDALEALTARHYDQPASPESAASVHHAGVHLRARIVSLYEKRARVQQDGMKPFPEGVVSAVVDFLLDPDRPKTHHVAARYNVDVAMVKRATEWACRHVEGDRTVREHAQVLAAGVDRVEVPAQATCKRLE